MCVYICTRSLFPLYIYVLSRAVDLKLRVYPLIHSFHFIQACGRKVTCVHTHSLIQACRPEVTCVHTHSLFLFFIYVLSRPVDVKLDEVDEKLSKMDGRENIKSQVKRGFGDQVCFVFYFICVCVCVCVCVCILCMMPQYVCDCVCMLCILTHALM
jgi:hypothetical protein